ncbi:hypothetical protein [Aeromonas media]|uniref:hypothetical protein n=1 Tax=Aeromonas media TaxID=651 RepID=UPI003D1CCBDF
MTELVNELVMSGAEFKAYWNDAKVWDDAETEDAVISINGTIDLNFELDDINDTDVIKIVNGVYYNDITDESTDLAEHAAKWKEKQADIAVKRKILLEVNEEDMDAMLAAIKSISSAKVIG